MCHSDEKSVEEITSSSSMITILEVTGVRFTSRNFQLELVLKQIMILENKPIFNNCLIKREDNASEETLERGGLKIPVAKKSDKDLDNSENSEIVETLNEASSKSNEDNHNGADIKQSESFDLENIVVETKELNDDTETQDNLEQNDDNDSNVSQFVEVSGSSESN